MMTERADLIYVRWLLGMAVVLLFLVALINYWVDPFGIFGRNRVGIYTASEREQRQGTAPWWERDAIVLSNSKLSMQDPSRLQGFEWYNMSASGARVEELTGMLEAYVRDEKLVVLGLDMWMFNESYAPTGKPFRPLGWQRVAEHYLLNASCLMKSIEALQKSARNEPVMSFPGGYTNEELAAITEREDPRRDFTSIYDFFIKQMAANYIFSERRLDHLRGLKEEMDKRGVELLVFLHPQNQLMRDLMATPEYQPHVERFLREMRALFPNLIDLTDSEYAEDRDFFLKDPIHYTPQVSTDFLNEAVIPQARAYRRQLVEEPSEPK